MLTHAEFNKRIALDAEGQAVLTAALLLGIDHILSIASDHKSGGYRTSTGEYSFVSKEEEKALKELRRSFTDHLSAKSPPDPVLVETVTSRSFRFTETQMKRFPEIIPYILADIMSLPDPHEWRVNDLPLSETDDPGLILAFGKVAISDPADSRGGIVVPTHPAHRKIIGILVTALADGPRKAGRRTNSSHLNDDIEAVIDRAESFTRPKLRENKGEPYKLPNPISEEVFSIDDLEGHNRGFSNRAAAKRAVQEFKLVHPGSPFSPGTLQVAQQAETSEEDLATLRVKKGLNKRQKIRSDFERRSSET
jgi:hypothetical protein